MGTIDLIEFAARIAKDSDTPMLLPVIEKELLHYEILGALDRAGLLEELTFQGGTCLRLCYGATRYSEDLDFAGGVDFDFSSISSLKDVLESTLSDRYIVEPSVIEGIEKTDESGVVVKKWQVKVVTAPQRPDIPVQRVSIEVASVPAHMRAVRFLRVNYEELPDSYANTLLHVETLEEICADKLKAFLTAGYCRYRDLWDMNWILQRPSFDQSQLAVLFEEKLNDYGQQKMAKRNLKRVEDIPSVVDSREFLAQMRRFIPTALLDQTLERPYYREAMSMRLIELYRSILRETIES